jgi:hypothetical protein
MAKLKLSLASVPDTVSLIQDRQRDRDALKLKQETELKQIDDQISKLTKGLRPRVTNGETTGDRIRDLVIRAHGVNEEIEQKCRDFESQLKGKKGEFALLSWGAKIRKYGPTDGYRTVDFYRLGVLEGEELVWHNELHVTLPITQHIGGEERSTLHGMEVFSLQKSNIFAQYGEHPRVLLVHLLSQIKIPPPWLAFSSLQILIGDEAVKTWLKNTGMESLFKPAADVLSKLILEPTEG